MLRHCILLCSLPDVRTIPSPQGPVEGLVTAAATEEAADASPTVYARAATGDRVDRANPP